MASPELMPSGDYSPRRSFSSGLPNWKPQILEAKLLRVIRRRERQERREEARRPLASSSGSNGLPGVQGQNVGPSAANTSPGQHPPQLVQGQRPMAEQMVFPDEYDRALSHLANEGAAPASRRQRVRRSNGGIPHALAMPESMQPWHNSIQTKVEEWHKRNLERTGSGVGGPHGPPSAVGRGPMASGHVTRGGGGGAAGAVLASEVSGVEETPGRHHAVAGQTPLQALTTADGPGQLAEGEPAASGAPGDPGARPFPNLTVEIASSESSAKMSPHRWLKGALEISGKVAPHRDGRSEPEALRQLKMALESAASARLRRVKQGDAGARATGQATPPADVALAQIRASREQRRQRLAEGKKRRRQGRGGGEKEVHHEAAEAGSEGPRGAEAAGNGHADGPSGHADVSPGGRLSAVHRLAKSFTPLSDGGKPKIRFSWSSAEGRRFAGFGTPPSHSSSSLRGEEKAGGAGVKGGAKSMREPMEGSPGARRRYRFSWAADAEGFGKATFRQVERSPLSRASRFSTANDNTLRKQDVAWRWTVSEVASNSTPATAAAAPWQSSATQTPRQHEMVACPATEPRRPPTHMRWSSMGGAVDDFFGPALKKSDSTNKSARSLRSSKDADEIAPFLPGMVSEDRLNLALANLDAEEGSADVASADLAGAGAAGKGREKAKGGLRLSLSWRGKKDKDREKGGKGDIKEGEGESSTLSSSGGAKVGALKRSASEISSPVSKVTAQDRGGKGVDESALTGPALTGPLLAGSSSNASREWYLSGESSGVATASVSSLEASCTDGLRAAEAAAGTVTPSGTGAPAAAICEESCQKAEEASRMAEEASRMADEASRMAEEATKQAVEAGAGKGGQPKLEAMDGSSSQALPPLGPDGLPGRLVTNALQSTQSSATSAELPAPQTTESPHCSIIQSVAPVLEVPVPDAPVLVSEGEHPEAQGMASAQVTPAPGVPAGDPDGQALQVGDGSEGEVPVETKNEPQCSTGSTHTSGPATLLPSESPAAQIMPAHADESSVTSFTRGTSPATDGPAPAVLASASWRSQQSTASGVTTVPPDVAAVQDDVTTAQDDVTTAQDDITTALPDFSSLQHDVTPRRKRRMSFGGWLASLSRMSKSWSTQDMTSLADETGHHRDHKGGPAVGMRQNRLVRQWTANQAPVGIQPVAASLPVLAGESEAQSSFGVADVGWGDSDKPIPVVIGLQERQGKGAPGVLKQGSLGLLRTISMPVGDRGGVTKNPFVQGQPGGAEGTTGGGGLATTTAAVATGSNEAQPLTGSNEAQPLTGSNEAQPLGAAVEAQEKGASSFDVGRDKGSREEASVQGADLPRQSSAQVVSPISGDGTMQRHRRRIRLPWSKEEASRREEELGMPGEQAETPEARGGILRRSSRRMSFSWLRSGSSGSLSLSEDVGKLSKQGHRSFQWQRGPSALGRRKSGADWHSLERQNTADFGAGAEPVRQLIRGTKTEEGYGRGPYIEGVFPENAEAAQSPILDGGVLAPVGDGQGLGIAVEGAEGSGAPTGLESNG